MAKTEIRIILGPDQYRFLRRELEKLLETLQVEYNRHPEWGDQNPERLKLNMRMANLKALIQEI